jgi:hypothetical protein
MSKENEEKHKEGEQARMNGEERKLEEDRKLYMRDASNYWTELKQDGDDDDRLDSRDLFDDDLAGEEFDRLLEKRATRQDLTVEEYKSLCVSKGWYIADDIFDKDAERPCYKLGYCPYGVLTRAFPSSIMEEDNCAVYGHMCPACCTAERGISETGLVQWRQEKETEQALNTKLSVIIERIEKLETMRIGR